VFGIGITGTTLLLGLVGMRSLWRACHQQCRSAWQQQINPCLTVLGHMPTDSDCASSSHQGDVIKSQQLHSPSWHAHNQRTYSSSQSEEASSRASAAASSSQESGQGDRAARLLAARGHRWYQSVHVKQATNEQVGDHSSHAAMPTQACCGQEPGSSHAVSVLMLVLGICRGTSCCWTIAQSRHLARTCLWCLHTLWL
jgi:hypothetical protein